MSDKTASKVSRPRYPQEFWLHARDLWENDPSLSFVAAAQRAAEDFGLSSVPNSGVVCRRASREHWIRAANLAQVRRRAHVAADEQTAQELLQSDGSTFGSAELTIERQVELRAAKLTEHRQDWPRLRHEIYEAVDELKQAQARALKLLADDRAAELQKPVAKRRTYTGRDELAYVAAAIRVARTKLEGLYVGVQALQTMQQAERRAWALDDAADDYVQFSEEDRARLDRMYAEAIDQAEAQAKEMAARMKQITALVAGGSASLH
jgi:hypothetical protein